jgi:hypothetical protein
MDTRTVLFIIKMLDEKLDILNKDKKAIDASSYSVLSKKLSIERINGATNALERLSNQLQDFIESQVNQVENEMNRGE